MKQHVVVMSVELNSMVNCLSRVLRYYRCRYLASKYKGDDDLIERMGSRRV